MLTPRFLDSGECALSVEFGGRIDPVADARVHDIDARLTAAAPVAGLLETVPTYRSFMIHYDPLVLPRRDLVALVTGVLGAGVSEPGVPAHRWRLPVCYDPGLADDLPHIARSTGLSPAMVTSLHAAASYRIAMFGFAPGWAYLSGLPAEMTLPRRSSPRDRIPAGSLVIAGGQAIVASVAMPSGWHILGRTPVRLFDPRRDPAFLVAPGDELIFEPVDLPTFRSLEVRAQAGESLIAGGKR
jgi:inhibitor of KinA